MSSNSNVTSVQDPRGFTSAVTVDVLRRVTQATSTAPFSFVTKFTFDDNGNTTKVERQTNDPLDPWQTSQASYTADNKVLTTTDPQGNITKTTYPDGYFVDRVYDELNRLTDIKLNGAGTSAVQFQYDALSRRTKLVYENGCTTNYTFEVDNDLSSLLHNFVGSNVQFNYSFDNANQMATHRVSDPANFRWNPPAPSTTAYGTASNINQYPTVGGTAQTYSTDGSLTNDGTFKYEFNTERMMTRVRNAGTNAIIADYLYDPELRQRQKNVGGVKTNYYYAGFQRLADYDGSAGTPGTLLNRYVYGTGMDEVLIQITAGGTKTYYHSNHQGSVIATTNSSGAVLNRYTYGPFGESVALTGTTHGYTGQRYDSETGLYYFKMRQYSPKLGRFLQPDPIGMAGGMNFYAYTGNSPLTLSDPFGLSSVLDGSRLRMDVAAGFYRSTTVPQRRSIAMSLVTDDLNGLKMDVYNAATYQNAKIRLDNGTTFTADYLIVYYDGTNRNVIGTEVIKIDTVTRLSSGEYRRDDYPGDASKYNDAVSAGNATAVGIPGVGRLAAGTRTETYDVTFYEPLSKDRFASSSSSGSVRLGYAGFGGALQGYTFDVLTRQWITDYDFYLLATGGLPAGGTGGAGMSSGGDNNGSK